MRKNDMGEIDQHKLPPFKGLNWYKDQHFSFFRPLDWTRFEWTDDRQGVLFGPSPEDTATLFAVDVKDLGLEVTPDDLEALMAGFVSGIEQLPDSQIESRQEWVAGAVIGLEAKYSFRENDVIRKRWIRVLYQDTRQITVMAQGATVAEFDYWLPMFFESMMTFKIHKRQAKPNK
jgi:hypothetical protein